MNDLEPFVEYGPADRSTSSTTDSHSTESDSASPMGWDRCFAELTRIGRLEDDWDGEGTEAPDPALIGGAVALARRMRDAGGTAPDRVHAGVNSTVYFEWLNDPAGYREVEIVSPDEAEERFVPRGSLTTESKLLACRA